MTKPIWTVAVCAMLLWAGPVLAVTMAQENCDKARIKAWAKYVSCVDTVVAKDAAVGGPNFDEFAAFSKCRRAYFKNWPAFQISALLATSTCVGSRFTNNSATVTDNLSGLVWEQKTNDASVHDEGTFYKWSTGAPWSGNGTAFTTFLTGAGTGLNVAGFAGANDWRLPTLVELQTIVLDFQCAGGGKGSACSCGPIPCIDETFGPTQSDYYWSATSYAPGPFNAWVVSFFDGGVASGNSATSKANDAYVRAVRGGL